MKNVLLISFVWFCFVIYSWLRKKKTFYAIYFGIGSFQSLEVGGACVRAMMFVDHEIEFDDKIIMVGTNIMIRNQN